MSAIVKPLIHPTGTIDGKGDAVNVEFVAAITKIDVPEAVSSNSTPEYQIEFHYYGASKTGTPNVMRWRYASAAARDASYTNILTLASSAIA